MTLSPQRPSATDDDLAGTLIEGKQVGLFEVFRVVLGRTGDHVVTAKTFRDCSLFGPCVIMPLDGSVIENCQLGDAGGDPRNLFVAPVGPRVTGALVFSGCTFDNCHFFNVGFTGTPDYISEMLKSAVGRGA